MKTREKTFSVSNQSGQYFYVGNGFFGPTKGKGGLQHHNFFIFDGKQHPKIIWLRGC